MKTIFTFLLLLLQTFVMHAQTAPIFTAADMPIPDGEIPIVTVDHTKIKNPTGGINQTWDYAGAIPTASSTNLFIKEQAPFFTNAGVDVYIDVFKKFNANFGYNISQEWDFDDTGIYDKGHYVYPQAYSLASFTGSDKDSLIMAEQGYIVDKPRVIIKFPLTVNSSWKSSSRRYTDFLLKVGAFGLNNTPARHVYTTVRQDSIIGWGKMRVPTENGTSKYYDVLMERVKSSIIDSFYLNGAPAPPAVLNGFGIAQGQKLDETNVYNFYRKGQANYFMRVSYGTDNTFTKPNGAFINIAELETSSSKGETEHFSSVIFPCPAYDKVNVLLGDINAMYPTYEIVDLSGKWLTNGQTNQSGNTITIDVQDLPNGNYFVKLHNSKNNSTRVEKIFIQR